MKRDFLLELLANIKNGKKEYRDSCAQKILNTPDLYPLLISETFNSNNKLSVKSAWVLEWICSHYNLDFIFSHIDEFTEKLSLLKFDGSKRSCLKICEQLSESYHLNKDDKIKDFITKEHIEKIIENCFDWLISDQTIAVKAYAMTTLYYFGFYTNWVHNELEKIIITDLIHTSKACEARGKKILKLLHKKNKK